MNGDAIKETEEELFCVWVGWDGGGVGAPEAPITIPVPRKKAEAIEAFLEECRLKEDGINLYYMVLPPHYVPEAHQSSTHPFFGFRNQHEALNKLLEEPVFLCGSSPETEAATPQAKIEFLEAVRAIPELRANTDGCEEISDATINIYLRKGDKETVQKVYALMEDTYRKHFNICLDVEIYDDGEGFPD